MTYNNDLNIAMAECIDLKFGRGTFVTNATVIHKKCNQKCLDTIKRIRKAAQSVSVKSEDKDSSEDVKKDQ